LCNSFALSIIHSSFTDTFGLSVTSTNCPPPFDVSTIIPVALSIYSITITPASEHKCKYHSIWQEDNDVTNKSSGLYLVLSPRNAGSEEPKILGLSVTVTS